MSDMSTPERMIDWLNEELERRNLSQSKASLRAGLGSSAISEIVNGKQPGLKVCVALAEYFKVPLTRMLYLAGHIDEEEAASRDAFAEQMLALSEHLSEQQKRALLDLIRSMAE